MLWWKRWKTSPAGPVADEHQMLVVVVPAVVVPRPHLERRGQSGLVFGARDVNNGRIVALKVLWPEFARHDVEIQRFIRAMKTVLPVRHPNIVTLWGAGKKE